MLILVFISGGDWWQKIRTRLLCYILIIVLRPLLRTLSNTYNAIKSIAIVLFEHTSRPHITREAKMFIMDGCIYYICFNSTSLPHIMVITFQHNVAVTSLFYIYNISCPTQDYGSSKFGRRKNGPRDSDRQILTPWILAPSPRVSGLRVSGYLVSFFWVSGPGAQDYNPAGLMRPDTWPLQGDVMTTAVLPLTPRMKSDHMCTFPTPNMQNVEGGLILFSPRSKDHTSTLANVPLSDSSN